MIETVRQRVLLIALAGWVNRHQLDIIDYLRAENRVLKEHLGGRRLRLTDAQRRRLAAKGHGLGRRVLRDVATLVTPDTILRWHGVARSTVADILRTHGIGPVPSRPPSWATFLAAHWGTIAAADCFTTEVWTLRGLVTYYTLFVIEPESRRVHLVGTTPHPDDAFVGQVARTLTDAADGILLGHRLLICDRDTKWSGAFRQTLGPPDAHVRCRMRVGGLLRYYRRAA